MVTTRYLSVGSYMNKCGKDCSVCKEGGHGPYLKMIIFERGKFTNLHIGKRAVLSGLVLNEVRGRWEKLVK